MTYKPTGRPIGRSKGSTGTKLSDETKKRIADAKRGEKNPMWKGEDATEKSKRGRAIRRYELGDCERCEQKAIDRHHVDGDTGNNDPSNIMRLCRRCHMEVDGRLSMLGYKYGKGRYLQREEVQR